MTTGTQNSAPVFETIIHDQYSEVIQHYKIGDPLILYGVISGRIVNIRASGYTTIIDYTCDQPNHKACCEAMAAQLNMWCRAHGPLCPDQVVRMGSNGPFLQAANAEYNMDYCPWCGTPIRDTWPLVH